ncbi:laminin subunit alpha-3 [Thunnus thynnus]|uniref:laminin subunit alpha-3 n=1 Tax=Thunnus thynnus TaxID=8237 RepID=UPI003529794C
MQRSKFLFCGIVWLFLLCFASVCPSTHKHQIHQIQHSKKRFCDPSFGHQIAGVIGQKCGSGFYRQWTGSDRGQCVPCSCNGLSNECDEHTGICVNCQLGTTGDHCERCKEGYYGNAFNRGCQACPCPSVWNNFALACMDIGSGAIECLCKPNYSGTRCERCASGYYGNPLVYGGNCKPCNCWDGTLNICDSLTGECITSGDSSCGDHGYECDSCTHALLVDLERMNDVLARLKRQLQNINHGSDSLLKLNNLEANISKTKILVGTYSTAVKHLDPKLVQLEADVNAVGVDLSQLINETLKTSSDLEIVVQSVNARNLKAEDLLSEVEALLTTIQDLIKKPTTVKPGDSVSESDKVRRMEKAQRIVREMRERGCAAQRDKAGSEQAEAHKLLDLINMTIHMATNQAVLNQTAASLMASDSSLRDLAELMSHAEDAVNRTQDLNLKSGTTLQHLQHLQAQVEKENSTLPPVTEMTRDLLKNITDIFLMLEEIKLEFENHAAQLDGAKPKLFNKLNHIQRIMAKVDITKVEEHAEELNRLATEFQQVLHNATNSTDLHSFLGTGAYNSIINALEKAEMAANQSSEASEQALKDVKGGGLVNRAEGLKDNSSHLQTEANETQTDLEMLSHTVNAHKDRVNKQKEKGESLRMNISTISDDLKKIKRNDSEVLIESAKTAASASNYTVSNVTERLKNISQELERITFHNVSLNVDDILNDSDLALESINASFSVLSDNITQVEAFSRELSPGANMTETIRQIKDLIEETRTFVNRLPLATTFNGKGHIELHPPRKPEDIKAFTAVDLLLNVHQNNHSKANRRRKRRQGKHANFFVFYLGNKNASGDYIGMAIRRNVLICVYKLGGVVHEVETSQITTTTNVKSFDFDRVMFYRVYQDAEVNITRNFTSEKRVSLPLKRNLPNTMTGILDLDPNNLVFYVGGYPEDFTPPAELRYPKYRGAMKLSYINDNPVCLFNYKRAINVNTTQCAVTIPRLQVTDYYEGTGYRKVCIKMPNKRILLKFHTNSRETNALLFYIENEESFFYVFVEQGFLKLQGQQAGQELRAQSAEKVSLFDKNFVIYIADNFTVQYQHEQNIRTEHIRSNYSSFYIGGLPAQLRQRHNITAPPLRGCVDQVKLNGDIIKYNRTIGVSDRCPHTLLGVRAATLYSALSVDSLFVRNKQPISLGFRSKDRHGAILRSRSQGSTSVNNFQLSLSDGYVVFSSDNHTLKSDKRYNDGSWHYLSAATRPTGLELSIDNVNVTQEQSPHIRLMDQNLNGKTFEGCIANLYSRSQQGIIPADLSLSQMGNEILGLCSLDSPPQTGHSPAPMLSKHKHTQDPAGTQCRPQQPHRGGYQLSEANSWLNYTVPQEDLNYRPHFSLEVKTKSSKGLILHLSGRGVIPLLALYMANGKVKMFLGQERIIFHKQKSNDGQWHKIEFSVESSNFHLLVDGIRVTDGVLPNNEGSALDLHNPVYLGGDPLRKISHIYDIPTDSIIGCIRNFKINEEAIVKPKASHKALPCLDEHNVMGTYFGGGHIILDNYFTAGSDFVLAFGLRPQRLTGLLFHVQSHKASLNVFLMENKVGVEVNDGNRAVSVEVTPPQNLCDGKFHMVSVSKKHEVIKLTVDSVSDQRDGPSKLHSTKGSLYIGGIAKQNGSPVSSPFVGCLRNVKIDDRPVAFETGSRVVGLVSINKCPVD